MNAPHITLPSLLRDVDPHAMSAKQRKHFAQWLETNFLMYAEEDAGTYCLHPDDIAVLQRWTQDAEPVIRQAAMQTLCRFGPLTWEELAQWTQDDDEDVAAAVIDCLQSIGFASQAAVLCQADKPRCVALLADAVVRKSSYAAAMLLRQLADDDEWLAFIWPAAEAILDACDPASYTAITVCFFEDVIPERNWDADDLHLRPWFTPQHTARQYALFKIAEYIGLDEGKLREIVAALTRSADREIARTARELLDKQKNGGGTVPE